LSDPPAWAPRYNIAPTQPVAAVLASPDQPQSQFRLLQWGLVPSWAKAPGVGADTSQAHPQGETVIYDPQRPVSERGAGTWPGVTLPALFYQ
jgi:putative SOS response-associated peptidase YedK